MTKANSNSRSREATSLDETLKREDFGTATDMDAGHDDLYTDESRTEREANAGGEAPAMPLTDWSRVGPGGRADGDEDMEGALTAAATLRDHLEAQLAIAALSPERRLIAVMLIESVDEAGYLRADLAEVASRLGATLEECEATLQVLQDNGVDTTKCGDQNCNLSMAAWPILRLNTGAMSLVESCIGSPLAG